MKKAVLLMLVVITAMLLVSCKEEKTESKTVSKEPVVSQSVDTDSDTDTDDSFYRVENGNIIVDYEDERGYYHIYTYYFDDNDMLTDIKVESDYRDEVKAQSNFNIDSRNSNYKDVELNNTVVSKLYTDEFIDGIYERRTKVYIVSLWDI